MKEEQQKYYQEEWARLKLSDKPGKSGWRTVVPAPDFIQFVAWLKERQITGKVLDLGCGGGRHSILLAQNGFETYGIDFADAAIKQAIVNAEVLGVENLTKFRAGDVLDLPYQDKYFDVVNDDGCLHHVDPKDWATYSQNVKRVIKHNGILRIKAFSKNCAYFEENASDDLSQWIQLSDSGYTYFFTEQDVRHMFADAFDIIKLEEKSHTETGAKKFFFVVLRSK